MSKSLNVPLSNNRHPNSGKLELFVKIAKTSRKTWLKDSAQYSNVLDSGKMPPKPLKPKSLEAKP